MYDFLYEKFSIIFPQKNKERWKHMNVQRIDLKRGVDILNKIFI